MTAQRGLTIVVANGRWDAYGDPTSERDKMLMRVLTEQGGINESVPDGTWVFDVVRDHKGPIATLYLKD